MKFENTEVWGFEHALRGMRNPKNSWDKSDSFYGCENGSNHSTSTTKCGDCLYSVECPEVRQSYIIGEKDIKLAQSLIKAGGEHRKFMRQIFVSVDITAPSYFMAEFDTYKVGVSRNSSSFMHKGISKPFEIEDFEIDDERIKQILSIKKQSSSNKVVYPYEPTENINRQCSVWEHLLSTLNYLRDCYLDSKDYGYFRTIRQILPQSYLYHSTITMSYENIYTICHQRRNHRLNEWSGIDNPNVSNFISWARSLPYAKELIFFDEGGGKAE